MIDVAIVGRSALGAPAALALTGHPAVRGVVVSRDLGDPAARGAALGGVPCLLLDFADETAADAALARLAALSAKFAHKESPTRLACSGEVHYTLRVVHGFDEPTIDAIATHQDEAVRRYAAARQGATAARRARR